MRFSPKMNMNWILCWEKKNLLQFVHGLYMAIQIYLTANRHIDARDFLLSCTWSLCYPLVLGFCFILVLQQEHSLFYRF